MSLLKRLEDLGKAAWGTVEAPFGFVKDLASAPWDDSADSKGLVHTLWSSATSRGAQAIGDAIGPQGITGTIFGAFPEYVRSPVRTVTTPALDASNWAYNNLVSHPISFLFTAGELADSKTYNNQHGTHGLNPLSALLGPSAGLTRPDTFKDAWTISKHRSPGQALALALSARDIMDPNELAKAQNTDFYNIVSGISDGIVRNTLDPTVIGGKVVEGARAAKLVESAETAQKAEQVAQLSKVTNRAQALDRLRNADNLTRTQQLAKAYLSTAQATQAAKDFVRFRSIDREAELSQASKDLGALRMADRERYLGSGQWSDTKSYIDDLKSNLPTDPAAQKNALSQAASKLTGRFFRDSDNGPLLSQHLINAKTAADQDRVMRFFLGDTTVMQEFENERAGIADALAGSARAVSHSAARSGLEQDLYDQLTERAVKTSTNSFDDSVDMFNLRHVDQTAISGLQGQLADTAAQEPALRSRLRELNQLLSTGTGTANDQGLGGAISMGAGKGGVAHAPRLTKGGAVRQYVDNSQFWQTSPFTKPVRVLGNLLPESDLKFDEPSSWMQLDRHLRDMGFTRDERAPFVTQWINTVPGSRPQLWDQIEHHAITNVASDYGLTYDDAMSVLKSARKSRRALSRGASSTRAYASEGRDLVTHNIVDANGELGVMGHPSTITGLTPAEQAADAADRAAAQGVSTANDATKAVAGQLLDETNDLGKPRPLASTQFANGVSIPLGAEVRGAFRRAGYTKLKALRPDLSKAIDSELADIADGEATSIRSAIENGADHGVVDRATEGAKRKLLNANAAFLRAKDTPVELMSHVTNAWRTAVLAHPAWTLHVIPEQSLRMFAKAHAMVDMMEAISKGTFNYSIDLSHDIGTYGNASIAGIVGGIAAGPAGAAVAAPLGAVLGKRWAALEHFGLEDGTINGFDIASVNGADVNSMIAHGASQDSSMRRFVSAEGKHLKRLRESYTPTIRAGDASYESNWLNAVNNQIGKDPLWSQALEGKTPEEMAAWLRKDPAGIAMREALPVRGANPEHWADLLSQIAVDYTKGDPEIMAAARNGNATLDMLKKVEPNTDKWPTIHGNTIEQAAGRGGLMDELHNFSDRLMKVMGTMPADDVNRIPWAHYVYNNEMHRLLDGVPDGAIREETLRGLQSQALNTAISSTRDLFHNLGERSDFAQMIRTISPFFGAYQQILSRWTGLAIDNPVFAARMRLAWDAPSKMYLGADQQKPLLYKDPNSGEEYLQFNIPEWARSLIGHGFLKSALDDQGSVRFAKNRLPGIGVTSEMNPGTGPFVNMALSNLVRERPDLESSVKKILPYGPSNSLIESFMPTDVRRLVSLQTQTDDRAYRNAYYQILMTRFTKMQQGTLPGWKPDDLNDPQRRDEFLRQAKGEADAFGSLRLVAGFLSPMAPQFASPYAPYIEFYRQLKQKDPQGADAKFLDQYGPELFALTQSFTKLIDGVPATVQGEDARKNHERLIQAYPELGGLIIGDEGGGEAAKFSQAVYDRQLSQTVGPGSFTKRRVALSPEDIITQPQVRLGWEMYSRRMDQFEAVRKDMGITGPGDPRWGAFTRAKSAVTLELGQENPLWMADFAQRDDLKWTKKLNGLRAIAADPNLSSRPDIQGLGQYMKYRDALNQVLQDQKKTKGGTNTLNDVRNRPLADHWESLLQGLISTNPAFAALYNRWLANDPIGQANTAPGYFGQVA